MPRLKFYDVKAKKSFTTDRFRLTTKRNSKTKRTVHFAVAKAPSGIEAWRIVKKEFYLKNK